MPTGSTDPCAGCRTIPRRGRTTPVAADAWRDPLALLLASTGEGIYGVDLDGLCVFINPAGARLIGYEPDEVRGLEADVRVKLIQGPLASVRLFPRPVFLCCSPVAVPGGQPDGQRVHQH